MLGRCVERSTVIESIEVAERARQALIDKKGEEIVLLDVRGVSSVTDYYLIATGSSAPHLKALAEEVARVLKACDVRLYRKSGSPDSEWIVEDYVDIVLHVFTPDSRKYYNLEQLWGDAKRVTA